MLFKRYMHESETTILGNVGESITLKTNKKTGVISSMKVSEGLNFGRFMELLERNWKDISKDNKEKFYIEVYYREEKDSATISIFNKDKLWIIKNVRDVDKIVKFIEDDIPCKKDDSIFYVDINGFGISIYDTLKENGYDVRKLECKILNN